MKLNNDSQRPFHYPSNGRTIQNIPESEKTMPSVPPLDHQAESRQPFNLELSQHSMDQARRSAPGSAPYAIRSYVYGVGLDKKTASSEDIVQSANQGFGKVEHGIHENKNEKPFSRSEQAQLIMLQKTDARIKAHEMAHLAAAGPYSRGGATFHYQRGPDGKKYAVGGEVHIDTSEENTPEATISKMMMVRAAALAPADPSPQDRKIAATASAAIVEARHELRIQEIHEGKGKKKEMGASERPESSLSSAEPMAMTRNMKKLHIVV